MSQSEHPKDTQALVQSMLQRLKLQPGRESQAHQHTAVPVTSVSTQGERDEKELPDFEKINSPVSDTGKNDIPSKELIISTANLKGGQMNGDLLSSHSQCDDIDFETGESRVLEDPTQPGEGQLFPAKAVKDADITSPERTAAETADCDGSSLSSSSANSSLDRAFTPRVYAWSLKNTSSPENKDLHVRNGELGTKTDANSSFRSKQRPGEKKSKRWTARIKERWRERQSSKKGKEEKGTSEQGNTPGTALAALHQPSLENPFNVSNDIEETLSSLDSSETPDGLTEDSTVDGHIRPAGDFDLGLGSFSLLDEIVKGQEWAKFLNPNVPAAPLNPTPPQELQVPLAAQSNLPNNNHPPEDSRHGTNQWSFTQPPPVFEISPDDFQPASMDVTEGSHHQSVQREADPSEPMEDGQDLSDVHPVDTEQEQVNPPSSVEPAARLQNVLVRSRLQLSRKRHHQQAEGRNETQGSFGMAGSAGSRPASAMTNFHSTPQSPLLSSPTAPAPRGVLKHTISQESQSSMETLTKRRRVEEIRHVRFSEEVVTIEALDLELSDSDEDSEDVEEEEENTVTEQENKVANVPMEEAAPGRRAALPNWILALKRKNTGKKPR